MHHGIPPAFVLLAAREPSRRLLASPCWPPPAILPQVTKEEYAKHGGPALGERLAAQLRQQGLNPFVIPVGGSSPMGVWGCAAVCGLLLSRAQRVRAAAAGRPAGVRRSSSLAAVLRRHRSPSHSPAAGLALLSRYIEMIRELEGQIAGQGFTDIAMVRRRQVAARTARC